MVFQQSLDFGSQTYHFGNAQFAHKFIYSCFNPNLVSDFKSNKANQVFTQQLSENTYLVLYPIYVDLGIEYEVYKKYQKKRLNLKSKDTFLVCLASVFGALYAKVWMKMVRKNSIFSCENVTSLHQTTSKTRSLSNTFELHKTINFLHCMTTTFLLSSDTTGCSISKT